MCEYGEFIIMKKQSLLKEIVILTGAVSVIGTYFNGIAVD